MSGLPESMTMDERLAVIESVNEVWGSISAGSVDANNALLLDHIRARPEFADAGISSDQSVWARFVDGRPVAFINKKSGPAATPNPGKQATKALERAEVPQGDRAFLFDVDKLAEGSIDTIAPALARKHYTVQRPAATIEQFLLVKNASVLFVSSHGGVAVNQRGVQKYVVMTGEAVERFDPTNAHQANIKSLADRNELMRISALQHDTNGVPVSRPKGFWAITDDFVRANWTFANNSLVAIDTCQLFFDSRPPANPSDPPSPDAHLYQAFRAAMTNVGAGSILGWADQVSPGFASVAMKYFFDRALGANAFEPEDPPQRPFPHADVFDWVHRTVKDGGTGEAASSLRLQERQAIPGQLTPSIFKADVYQPAPGSRYAGTWVLEVAGEFGSEPGVVTLDGVAMPPLEGWNENLMLFALPSTMKGPGSSGDLLVTVRDHPSNAVPLTRWTGTVSQVQLGTIGSGSRFEVTCPTQATGEIHTVRERIGEAASRTGTAWMKLDGNCTYALSGTWTQGDFRYDLSGSGTATLLVGGPHDERGGVTYNATSSTSGTFTGVFAPLVAGSGTLKITNVRTGTAETQAAGGNWAAAVGPVPQSGGLVLGGSRPCTGPPGCTETWSMTPSTPPVPQTES